MVKKVLFLCTENSARSQIAEAILNTKGKDNFIAYSAGSQPAGNINPYAQIIIEELDVDISNYKPKSIDEFLDEEFDFVITLCDKMKNECPAFSNNAIHAHWGLSDPKDFEGTDEEKIKQFKKVKNELITRINIFLTLPIDKLDKTALRQKLNDILGTDYNPN